MKNEVLDKLREIESDVRSEFGSLSAEQLNWKPSESSWSVAQCLDHLIKTNAAMLPAIDAKIAGASNSLWEGWSPLTGFFGRFLSNAMPRDNKKYKAPSKAIVPPSSIEADIVDRFSASQAEVIEKVRALGSLDWDKTVITSPFMKLMTYRLTDGVTILVEHERRHIRQAKRVMQEANFPEGQKVEGQVV
ncbi:MAG: DinB family protein [Pyrinomonadaceae bacterium]